MQEELPEKVTTQGVDGVGYVWLWLGHWSDKNPALWGKLCQDVW